MKRILVWTLGLVVLGACTTEDKTQKKTCRALFVIDTQLWVSAGESTQQLVYSDSGGVNLPRWSPSGGRIAYVRNFDFMKGELSALVIIDATGRYLKEIPITEESSINRVLRFGWRNEKTLWTEGHANPTTSLYHEWDVDTGHLLTEKMGLSFSPAANNKRLAYLSHVPPGAPSQYAVRDLVVDDMSAYPKRDDAQLRFASPLVWSNDSARLAWVETREGNAELVTFNVAASTVIDRIPLGKVRKFKSLSWKPDQTGLIFEDSEGFWEVGLTTHQVQKLTQVPEFIKNQHKMIQIVDEQDASVRNVPIEDTNCGN